MYYLVTIGYETEQTDRRGNTRVRVQKAKHLIQAESTEEVSIIAARYRSEDNRDSEVLSIVRMNIESLIDEKNTPEYYK